MEKSIFTPEYATVLRLLKQMRSKADITQVQLAKKIDETQSYVSKVERGDLRLDIVQLRSWCRALGTTLPTFVEKFEREHPQRSHGPAT